MNDKSTSSQILAPIWKRKWLILAVGVIVALGSYFYYKRQPAIFGATTTINLAGGEEQSSTGSASAKAATKTLVTDAPAIIGSGSNEREAKRILKAQGKKVPKGKVKAKASATGGAIVEIYAEAHGAKNAARLANAYATAYIARANRAYRNSVERQIADRRRQLARIEAGSIAATTNTGTGTGKGKSKGSSTGSGAAVIQEANLTSQINQLESALHVQGIQEITVATPHTAELLEPMPKQNAIFGFLLGVVLAIFVAFGLERLDRTLRDIGYVEGSLGGPLLAAVPRLKRPIRDDGGQISLAPRMQDAIRRANATLTTLELADGRAPRTLLCTSPDVGDGKSTLTAALAVVKAEAGEHVVVLETDFKAPRQGEILGVGQDVGLVDVLTGALPLEDVVRRVPIAFPAAAHVPVAAGAGEVAADGDAGGSVSAIVGRVAEHPPSLATPTFRDLLKRLSDEYDCVLVDVETELESADTIAAMREVEAIILIGRIGASKDASVERLEEVLDLPGVAPVIGTVANCASDRDLERNGLRGARRVSSRKGK